MIRLTLLTLAALFAVLTIYGKPDPNAPRKVGQVAARQADSAPVAADPQPSAEIVKVVSQTPQKVQKFPGPALRPSPEHADDAEIALAELAPAADTEILYITGKRVNFRAGPSTNDRVIGALLGGSPVEAIGDTNGGWINIRDAQGRVGYVSASLLSAKRP